MGGTSGSGGGNKGGAGGSKGGAGGVSPPGWRPSMGGGGRTIQGIPPGGGGMPQMAPEMGRMGAPGGGPGAGIGGAQQPPRIAPQMPRMPGSMGPAQGIAQPTSVMPTPPQMSSIPGGPATSWRPQTMGTITNEMNDLLKSESHTKLMQDNQHYQKLYENLPEPMKLGFLRTAKMLGGGQSQAKESSPIQMQAPQVSPTNSVIPNIPANQMQQGNPQQSTSPLLGSVSSKYETSGRGAGTVGYDKEGGWSYGSYQLANKPGTLRKFLQNSEFGSEFKGLNPGTQRFNTKWKSLANNPEFEKSQHQFIESTHYNPARAYADKLGIPDDPAVNQAIWSSSVQHGGVRKVIQRAYNKVKNALTPENFINALYDVRKNYTVGNAYASTLHKRYDSERKDVINLLRNR